MDAISFKEGGDKHVLCVIDAFTKYTWVKPVKNKKAKTVLHSFIKIVNEVKSKPNKHSLIKEKTFTIALCN